MRLGSDRARAAPSATFWAGPTDLVDACLEVRRAGRGPRPARDRTGAGKTTRSASSPRSSRRPRVSAWVDGLDVREEPDEIRRRIGILTETPGLYDKLSAERTSTTSAGCTGCRRPSAPSASSAGCASSGSGTGARRPAGTFSKGMRQKLAIARALLHEPRVLFLDEPTAGLDPEAAFIVREAIAALRGEGRTIVLCTHNLDEADRLSDRIAFLRTTLLRIDSPSRLRGSLGGGTMAVRLAERRLTGRAWPRCGALAPVRR